MRFRRVCNQYGFNTLELLIVVSIVEIFQKVVDEYRIKSGDAFLILQAV